MTILVVEDDPGFRCLMREFLLCGGFDVESAESGVGAVKAALAEVRSALGLKTQ